MRGPERLILTDARWADQPGRTASEAVNIYPADGEDRVYDVLFGQDECYHATLIHHTQTIWGVGAEYWKTESWVAHVGCQSHRGRTRQEALAFAVTVRCYQERARAVALDLPGVQITVPTPARDNAWWRMGVRLHGHCIGHVHLFPNEDAPDEYGWQSTENDRAGGEDQPSLRAAVDTLLAYHRQPAPERI